MQKQTNYTCLVGWISSRRGVFLRNPQRSFWAPRVGTTEPDSTPFLQKNDLILKLLCLDYYIKIVHISLF